MREQQSEINGGDIATCNGERKTREPIKGK